MSDLFPGEPGQDDAALAPELARLDELLLAEGRRWRRNEPSTAQLERHVRALVRTGGAEQRNEDVMLSEREPTTYDTPTPDPASRRLQSRWRGPLAAVATVLLVAMAATVFAFLSARSIGTGVNPRGAKATPTPGFTRVTAIQPKDTNLPMPKNAYLADISLSSAHDGWAVGGIRIPDFAGQDFSSQRAVLVHYHDGVWTAASGSFPRMSLNGVSMVSADDGWAVGMTINPPDNSGGVPVLLHYTGGHWVKVDAPALAGVSPETIRMRSPDFGYITGVVDVPSTTMKGSFDQLVEVVVYQNGAWKAIRTPFPDPNSHVVMVSASEGWASAVEDLTKPGEAQNQQATLYHYLNGVWTKSLTFPGYVTSLSAASPADVWALAVQCVNCTEPKPRIEHYNGTAWEQMSPPDQASFPSLPRTQAGELIGQSLFDGASSGVWISYVTQNTTITTIKNVYATWTWKKKPSGDGWQIINPQVLEGEVTALTADSNGGVWALAQAGNPPMNSPLTMTILYTQGSSWKVYGRSR